MAALGLLRKVDKFSASRLPQRPNLKSFGKKFKYHQLSYHVLFPDQMEFQTRTSLVHQSKAMSIDKQINDIEVFIVLIFKKKTFNSCTGCLIESVLKRPKRIRSLKDRFYKTPCT